MPAKPKLVDEIESSITRDFSMSYDELKKLHSVMLEQITSTANRSPAYSSIKHITDISQLGELPMTTYAQIQEIFDQLGTEKVLFTEPAIFWYTSGSTGKQKKIYYGKGDLGIIAQGFLQLLYLSGARVTDSAWVFTSTGGDTLFSLVLEKYGVKGIISTLTGEMDLINALKNASRLERIDLLVGVTWLYLVMHKVAHNPKEFEAIVEKAVRQKVKVPGLSWLVRKILMRGINYKRLAEMLSKTRLGFSHAEALSPYLNRIHEVYPTIEMHDVFGGDRTVGPGDTGLDRAQLAQLLPQVLYPGDREPIGGPQGEAGPFIHSEGGPLVRVEEGYARRVDNHTPKRVSPADKVPDRGHDRSHGPCLQVHRQDGDSSARDNAPSDNVTRKGR